MRTIRVGVAFVLVGACHREAPSPAQRLAVGSGFDVTAAESAPALPASAPSATSQAVASVPASPPDRSWIPSFKGSKTFAEKHPLGVLTVAFLPDGVRGMSSGVDETACLWDLRTGAVLSQRVGPLFKFIQVVFTRDGLRAVSAGDRAAYWEVATGNVVRELVAPENDSVFAVAISRDDHRAASASAGSSFVWNLDSGTPIRSFKVRGHVLSLRFGDDDRHLQAVTDEFACVVEAQGSVAPVCHEFPLLDIGVVVSASAQETKVLLGTRSGELFVWDSAANKLESHWSANRPTREVVGIDFRSDLHRAIAGGDSTVRLWDVQKGVAVAQLPGVPKWANAVAMSDDGQLALIGAEGGTVQLWKLPR